MILSGKEIAHQIHEEIKGQVADCSRTPALAVILVGDHPSSHAYVNMKRKACEKVGVRSIFHHLLVETTQEALLVLIEDLNADPSVDGILVQLPLPAQINPNEILLTINPAKDVDGFHPINLGLLLGGTQGGFYPCTPLGIDLLLKRSHIPVEGKHVVIVGRSAIVGRPLALLLLQENATVTIVHSKTPDPSYFTRQADILVAAVGQPRFITADMVKDGAVVIDVGITREADPSDPKGYRLVGDVDFENVEPICSAITPVPGGIGPMTVAMLLSNTLLSYQRRYG